MKPEETQTHYLYTWRTIECFHSIGHMLMASAQRWVDNQCCKCVLPCPDYETPIIPQLAATALILLSDTWEYVMESA